MCSISWRTANRKRTQTPDPVLCLVYEKKIVIIPDVEEIKLWSDVELGLGCLNCDPVTDQPNNHKQVTQSLGLIFFICLCTMELTILIRLMWR